jgi:fumarylacetoacetase
LIPYSINSTHFPLENLPFGTFINPKTKDIHCATRIGDKVIDLAVLEKHKLLDGPLLREHKEVFNQKYLNTFMGLSHKHWSEVRHTLQRLFAEGNSSLSQDVKAEAIFDSDQVELTLPVFTRDFTDFYSSYNHVYNCGIMFRSKEEAVYPNWKHIPVGYHGRASTIILSGSDIIRPKG